jgi:hypothetical protein
MKKLLFGFIASLSLMSGVYANQFYDDGNGGGGGGSSGGCTWQWVVTYPVDPFTGQVTVNAIYVCR